MNTSAQLAIIGGNSLELLGLKALLKEFIPFATIQTFSTLQEAKRTEQFFFHYFITTEILQSDVAFFEQHNRQTIVLVREDHQDLPGQFHQINVNLPIQSLMAKFLVMKQHLQSHQEKFPTEMVSEVNHLHGDDQVVLTNRELEVLKCVAAGKASKEIAEQLHISFSTVLTHRKNIMEKMGVHSSTKLVIAAVVRGFINTDDVQE